MTRAPTDRQLEVLATVRDFTKANGYAPTIRELGQLLGIASTNGVADHLSALQRRGLVTHEPRCGRTLRLTRDGRRELREASL